jgi:hypothetical protein
MQFSIRATGAWTFLRVRDNIAEGDDVFNGDATNAQTVSVKTGSGSSGNISVWARSAAGSNDEEFAESRPVRENEPVEIEYSP